MRRLAALVAGCLVATTAVTAGADARRAPTGTERTAIKRAVLRDCRSQDQGCVFDGAHLSTADGRFAYARTRADSFYGGGLLKRSGRRWRVVMAQGGGIMPCSDWIQASSARVVLDLRISGIVPGEPTGVRCG